MRNTLLSIFLGMICFVPICLVGQLNPQKALKPQKIKFKGHQLTHITAFDSGYDPDLLIRHFDQKSQKWGYIHRTTKRLMVPHFFDDVGDMVNGSAFALKLNGHFGIDTYWIGQSGETKLLFADTALHLQRTEFVPSLTTRFVDDHLFVARGGRVKTFTPDGTMSFDTLAADIPAKEKIRYFQYFGNGNMLIKFQDAMVFWDHELQQSIRFDTSDYTFPPQMTHESGHTRKFDFCDIQRKSDGKIGLIDRHGKLVVDFVWDEANPNTFLKSKIQTDPRFYPYLPNKDSIFLAYKNGVAYYVHINGEIIFEFPPNTFAFSPQYAFWPEQNLFQMVIQLESKKLMIHLVDPISKEVKLKSYSELIYLDSNRVVALSLNKDPKIAFDFAYTFHSAPTFEQIEIPNLANHIRPAEVYYYDKQYYWVIKNFHTGKYGLMDAAGNFIFLPTFENIGSNSTFDGIPFPFLYLNSDNESIRYYADAKGNIFYGTGIYYYDVILGKSDEYRFSSEIYPIPDVLSDCHIIDNIIDFYPNYLNFVSQYNKKGKKIGTGFIDIYGQVYF